MASRYAIVVTGYDGTLSICGTFADEYRATLLANEIETEESGLLASVCEIESPAEVRATLGLHAR
jgi:hypothetical protein